MKAFLDCEFDGLGGPLISIALVALHGPGFVYVVVQDHAQDPWVQENVIPRLGDGHRCVPGSLPHILATFINSYDDLTIIADWPDDFSYLMKALITGPGTMAVLKAPLKMEMITDLPGTADNSIVPHNALEDARSLRQLYLDHV